MILITGGTGFIGRNFLKTSDVTTVLRGYDLRKWKDTVEGFSRALTAFSEIDCVIHTAGTIGGILGNRQAKGRYFYENMQININVLEACRLLGINNVLSFASSCAYPLTAPMPYVEEDFHNGFPHEDHYGYAFAKRMLDIQARTYREQYGVNFNTVILSNVYGPYDHFGKETGHVTPNLIHKCAKAKKHGGAFTVWGTGKPLRDFMYVEDVVKISKLLVKNYSSDLPINLGTPVETSIQDMAKEIARAFKFEGYITNDTEKPDGQFRKPVNYNRLTKFLGKEYQFISVEEGIKKTVAWYLENIYKDI